MNAKLSTLLVCLLPLSVAGCSATQAVTEAPAAAVEAEAPAGLPPLRAMLECLPPDAAMVAAHRGTGDFLGAPENSVSGLEKLIEAGVMMAEIDIAKIKDGTLISFHDGVWEEKASGTGPVVATTAEEFARIRLRVKEGGTIGGEAVPTLDAMLRTAKDRIYLELDMKTSADIGRVVDAVRQAGMSDQVVLIASSDDEAEELKALGDEFILSLPYRSRKRSGGAKQGVWVGGRWRDDAQDELARRHIILGSQWERQPNEVAKAARRLDILATDQPTRYAPLEGLTNRARFDACVAKAG